VISNHARTIWTTANRRYFAACPFSVPANRLKVRKSSKCSKRAGRAAGLKFNQVNQVGPILEPVVKATGISRFQEAPAGSRAGISSISETGIGKVGVDCQPCGIDILSLSIAVLA